MGLKALMAHLKNRAADTPEKTMGYQQKTSIHAACTLDTPDTSKNSNSRKSFQTGPFGEAVNDPASSEPPADPEAWRELAQAYYRHHFNCVVCIAAGRGANYGPRCGAGAALWRAYDDSIIQTRGK